MQKARKPIFTRKRLLVASLLLVTVLATAWFFGRFPMARWAIDKSLAAANLQPATYQLDSVSLHAIGLSNLSIGTTPWLQASNINVTFTLANLFKSRVSTIQITGAQWTAKSRDNNIDWGYIPAQSTNPSGPINLPCDLIELKNSTIHAIIDDLPHDVQIAGKISPTAPGVIVADLDLSAPERRLAVYAEVTTSASQITAEIDGPIPSFIRNDGIISNLRAKWHATVIRDRTTETTTLDFDTTYGVFSEHVGAIDISSNMGSARAHAAFGKDGLTAFTASLSMEYLQVGQQLIRSLELKGTKLRGQALELEVAAKADSWQLPSSRAAITWTSQPQSTNFSIAFLNSQPISFEFQSFSGTIESLQVDARVQKDSSGTRLTGGQLTLANVSVHAGDFTLSDAHAVATMKSTDEFEISNLAATIDDGGTVSIDPFTWHPSMPHIHARAALTNLDLEHWLPILTSKHATGEGRMSGNIDLSVDWSTGAPKLGDLSGSLHSDPSHGYIQVTDADSVGDILDKQDPRFATDELMRPIRDKIVEALRDFSYKTLTVDLTRKDDRTVALTYLSGFGRHGKDPQGLNLTLDLHVQDAVLDLASRIAAKSQVTKAARTALDDFFKQPAPEKP